jgi:malic enzyme
MVLDIIKSLNLPTYRQNRFMGKKETKKEALAYHAEGRPGKIEVVPTKQYSSQRDLSLAYSPGVAEPCKQIAEISVLIAKSVKQFRIKPRLAHK